MERRGAHGVETIAPPQEVKRTSSKACRAKNLQVSAMGRKYSLMIDGRAIVARRRGRAAGGSYRHPLARRDPLLTITGVGYRAIEIGGARSSSGSQVGSAR